MPQRARDGGAVGKPIQNPAVDGLHHDLEEIAMTTGQLPNQYSIMQFIHQLIASSGRGPAKQTQSEATVIGQYLVSKSYIAISKVAGGGRSQVRQTVGPVRPKRKTTDDAIPGL